MILKQYLQLVLAVSFCVMCLCSSQTALFQETKVDKSAWTNPEPSVLILLSEINRDKVIDQGQSL